MTANIELKYGEHVSKQSLQENLDSPEAETFFSSLVAKALNSAKTILPHSVVNVPGVDRIFIADSSTLALRRPTALHLPGTDGSGPEASLKQGKGTPIDLSGKG